MSVLLQITGYAVALLLGIFVALYWLGAALHRPSSLVAGIAGLAGCPLGYWLVFQVLDQPAVPIPGSPPPPGLPAIPALGVVIGVMGSLVLPTIGYFLAQSLVNAPYSLYGRGSRAAAVRWPLAITAVAAGGAIPCLLARLWLRQ